MKVRHPIFARVHVRMALSMERVVGAYRQEALAGLSGRVVEVGSGTGLNFGHYPPMVTEVIAIEPERYLRHKSVDAARSAAVRVRVVEASADALPLDDGAVDAGVSSLVLCSVPDPHRALAELHRVIRPDGELRFFEHVRSSDPRKARFQDRADLIWPRLLGGCHPNRDTEASMIGAGFVVDRCRRFDFLATAMCKPVAPHILGVARRDGEPASRGRLGR